MHFRSQSENVRQVRMVHCIRLIPEIDNVSKIIPCDVRMMLTQLHLLVYIEINFSRIDSKVG